MNVSSDSQKVIAIVGPTAVGKSSVALRVAEELGGEIVNADALQVYRGFDIGTSKPTVEDRERVRHHLIDILDPSEAFSAGCFRRRALAAIGEIHERGSRAVVVGGSGLYLRALFEGISPIPPPDPKVRQRLRERLESEGAEALHGELSRVDSATARRLSPGDSQRVVRALEVALATGRPLSSWIEAQPFGEDALPSARIGLTVARGILYDRVVSRVARMIEQGWIQEVRALLAGGHSADLPAFQAIGYRQIAKYLRGDCSLQDAVEDLTKATRRFAKRQETWFRKESMVVWFDGLDLDRATLQICEYLNNHGAGRANA